MENNRVVWIDYMKAISMMLVVVYHTPERYQILDEGVIFNLGVPVFFFLAGLLYNPSKYSNWFDYILHRSRQLLVPYTTFFVLFYVLWILVGRRMVGGEEENIGLLLPLYEWATGQPTVVVGTFWYVACLFSMQVVYHLLSRLVPRRWCMVAVSVVLLLSTWVCYVHEWNIGKAFIYMPLYAVGHWVSDKVIARRGGSPLRATVDALLLVAGIAWLACSATLADRLLFRYATVAGVLMILPAYVDAAKALARRWGSCGVVTHIAVYGITFLALQNYLIGVIKIVLMRTLGAGVFDQYVWLKLVVAVAVMILIYPCSLAIARYLPWMLGRGRMFDKLQNYRNFAS